MASPAPPAAAHGALSGGSGAGDGPAFAPVTRVLTPSHYAAVLALAPRLPRFFAALGTLDLFAAAAVLTECPSLPVAAHGHGAVAVAPRTWQEITSSLTQLLRCVSVYYRHVFIQTRRANDVTKMFSQTAIALHYLIGAFSTAVEMTNAYRSTYTMNNNNNTHINGANSPLSKSPNAATEAVDATIAMLDSSLTLLASASSITHTFSSVMLLYKALADACQQGPALTVTPHAVSSRTHGASAAHSGAAHVGTGASSSTGTAANANTVHMTAAAQSSTPSRTPTASGNITRNNSSNSISSFNDNFTGTGSVYIAGRYSENSAYVSSNSNMSSNASSGTQASTHAGMNASTQARSHDTHSGSVGMTRADQLVNSIEARLVQLRSQGQQLRLQLLPRNNNSSSNSASMLQSQSDIASTCTGDRGKQRQQQQQQQELEQEQEQEQQLQQLQQQQRERRDHEQHQQHQQQQLQSRSSLGRRLNFHNPRLNLANRHIRGYGVGPTAATATENTVLSMSSANAPSSNTTTNAAITSSDMYAESSSVALVSPVNSRSSSAMSVNDASDFTAQAQQLQAQQAQVQPQSLLMMAGPNAPLPPTVAGITVAANSSNNNNNNNIDFDFAVSNVTGDSALLTVADVPTVPSAIPPTVPLSSVIITVPNPVANSNTGVSTTKINNNARSRVHVNTDQDAAAIAADTAVGAVKQEKVASATLSRLLALSAGINTGSELLDPALVIGKEETLATQILTHDDKLVALSATLSAPLPSASLSRYLHTRAAALTRALALARALQRRQRLALYGAATAAAVLELAVPGLLGGHSALDRLATHVAAEVNLIRRAIGLYVRFHDIFR
mgnify:FL=1